MNITKSQPDKSNRFIYIIGNNGSGKSTFLRRQADKLRGEYKKVIAIPCGIFDRFDHKSVDNYYYLGYKSNTNSVFFSTINKTITTLALGLIAGGKVRALEDILQDIGLSLKFEAATARWDKRTPQTRRASEEDKEVAEQIITKYENDKKWEELSPSDAYLLEARIAEDLKFYAKFKHRHSNNYVFPDELSSGYLQRLKMLLTIKKEAVDNTLILIDEPEISLHVTWQSELPKLFRSAIADLTGCTLMVATHSPVVVSNVTQERDVLITVPENEQIASERLEENIESLLFEKFGYLSLSSHIIPDLCTEIIYKLTHNYSAPDECRSIISAIEKNELSQKDAMLLAKTLELIEIAEKKEK